MTDEKLKEIRLNELRVLLYRIARIEHGTIIDRDPKSAREFNDKRLSWLIGLDEARTIIDEYLESNDVRGEVANIESYILTQ